MNIFKVQSDKNKTFIRQTGLDYFRVFLALWCCLFHANINSRMQCDFGVLNPYMSLGGVSMTGFFMLSGFCLFLRYGDKGFQTKTEYVHFYWKRIVSIIPLYYAVSIIFKVLVSTDSLRYSLLIIPIEALGVQSVFSSLFTYSHISGTWFISCLIMFYIVFPLVTNLINFCNKKMCVIVMGIIYIIIIYSTIIVHVYGTQNIYTNPFFRILECIEGVLLAHLLNFFRGGGREIEILYYIVY